MLIELWLFDNVSKLLYKGVFRWQTISPLNPKRVEKARSLAKELLLKKRKKLSKE
jgi:hypothetical protein